MHVFNFSYHRRNATPGCHRVHATPYALADDINIMVYVILITTETPTANGVDIY